MLKSNKLICPVFKKNPSQEPIDWALEELKCELELASMSESHNQLRKSSIEEKSNSSPFKDKGNVSQQDRWKFISVGSPNLHRRKRSQNVSAKTASAITVPSAFVTKSSKAIPAGNGPRKSSFPMAEDIKFLLGELRRSKQADSMGKSTKDVPMLSRDVSFKAQAGPEYVLTVNDIQPCE
eukprot:CAMPEP_0168334610 /NCGR_PEP_ID=MMETSP0213-20121227/10385_1 /TAXON_ID=151035 /ORGANISM="Euplotes harpa, Strain FSP1.4" /LENGTH=179 /DNA_ID=CAMNT_0008339317 /DNA_START=118 /DNA_END=657 /DNA_ORIENTATION=-